MRYHQLLREYGDNDKMDIIRRAMEAAGMSVIGDGLYSMVMRARDGGVVKIFEPDPCYQSFVQLAKKHSGNPHFPKVRKVAQFTKGAFAGNYLVKLEPLRAITLAEYNSNIGFHSYYVFSRPSEYKHDFCWSDGVVKDHVTKTGDDVNHIAETWAKDNREFAEAIQLIWNSRPSRCNEDLHFQNIMRRGQTWVIIDPYS